MSEASIALPILTDAQRMILWGVLLSAVIALLYGLHLVRAVLAADPGPKSMTDVASAIEEGAMAYLRRQIRTMRWFVLIVFVGLFMMYRHSYAGQGLYLPIGVAVAFLMGVTASYGAGFVGMWLAVKGNVRSANAALTSFKAAMELAFKAGGVSGMFTVGLGLLGATIIFLIYGQDAMKVLVGFGFGGSLAALFMRVGGGIFTKAADVGGDLVGKIEAGIPEDDPRNAATIADNVGDNVGDCAGMAADVFESYEVTLVAAIILAAYAIGEKDFIAAYGAMAGAFAMKLIIFALMLRAVGVFSSIAGIMAVRVPEGTTMRDPMRPIIRGYLTSAVLSVIGFFIVNALYLDDPRTGAIDWRFSFAATIGVVLSVVTLWLTNYFTHPDYPPVTECATAAKTGPATLILAGLAEGLESSVWALMVIAASIIGAMLLFRESPALQFYGIALTGLGLLTTTGFILAMDTYGPITDNAHGIFEMGGIHQEEASRTLSWMDAIGNTTKALTKGLAIASAVIAAVALFRSFIDEAHLTLIGVQVNMPTVFVGMMIGGAVPFLFSSFAIKAVGRSAYQVVVEVRRQFREHPGIMEGTEKPDYSRCVDIVTASAQKELLGPAILAIFGPLLVGFGLGAGALGGFLGGAILTGQLMAVFMSNAGGTWDNAKKKVEDGFLGGKGTDVHKATVVGDTVGDPFKDTAGPALNPMIKVMNLVAILAAPFVPSDLFDFSAGSVLVVAVAIALITVAVVLSKRGSIAEDEAAPSARAAA